MALLRHGQRMPSNRHEELIQIVRKYYGGREISKEDLERALLVGMSPHNRRKFEKRQLSSKHSAKINISKENRKKVITCPYVTLQMSEKLRLRIIHILLKEKHLTRKT